ncbi:MAG: hypothetical protein KAH20_08440 [Methylococcales bacterium]|nr:hypothetical protein [Methylococcales bacterium]
MEIKEKIYICTIALLLCLAVWLLNTPKTLNEKFLNKGSAMVFSPNISDLNKSNVYDLITNEKVKPCRQIQNKKSTQISSKKECGVKIIEEDGNVVLITKEGERIIPEQVSHHTIVRYKKKGESIPKKSVFQLIQPISTANAGEGQVCLSDLNGVQHDRCWPESVVRNYCQSNSHALCNLI